MNTWPEGNGVRIGITTFDPSGTSVERTSIPFFTIGDAYVWGGGFETFIPTGDQTGTLRLTRTGSTMAGLYLDKSGQWVPIGSKSFGTGDVVIDLQAWNDLSHWGAQDVEVTFLDTAISSTGSVPPDLLPMAENSSVLVSARVALPLGLHFLYGFRNRKTASLPIPWPDLYFAGRTANHSTA